MTSDQGFGAVSPERMASAGAVFRIERRGRDYLAAWIRRLRSFRAPEAVTKFPSIALAEAFAKGGWPKVTRLYRQQEFPRAPLASRAGMVPRL